MDLTSYLLGKKASGGGGGGDLDWTAIGYNSTPQFIADAYSHAKNIYDNWDKTQTNIRGKFENDTGLIIMPFVDTSNATKCGLMFIRCCRLITIPLLDLTNVTECSQMFYECTALKTLPNLDLSKCEDASSMCYACWNLESIGTINVQSVSNASYMFYQCRKLKDIPKLNLSSVTNINNMFNDCRVLTNESLDNILQTCVGMSSYEDTKTLYKIGFRSGYQPVATIQSLPHYQDFINAGWTIGY